MSVDQSDFDDLERKFQQLRREYRELLGTVNDWSRKVNQLDTRIDRLGEIRGLMEGLRAQGQANQMMLDEIRRHQVQAFLATKVLPVVQQIAGADQVGSNVEMIDLGPSAEFPKGDELR